MDASNVQPTAFATDTMNGDMDIDMDIDLTTADDIEAFDTEGITIVRPHGPPCRALLTDRACAG